MILASRAATRQRFSDSSKGEPVPMSVTSESPPSSSRVRNTRSACHSWFGALSSLSGVLFGGGDQSHHQLGSLAVCQTLVRQRLPGLECDGVADRSPAQSRLARPACVQSLGDGPRIGLDAGTDGGRQHCQIAKQVGPHRLSRSVPAVERGQCGRETLVGLGNGCPLSWIGRRVRAPPLRAAGPEEYFLVRKVAVERGAGNPCPF